MKRYLIYILSAYAGLVFRTFLSTLAGEGYNMNGLDIYNALVCLLICYYGRVIAECVRERRAQARERHASGLEKLPADRADSKAA